MMHDLTNIQKTFNELIMSRLDDKILERKIEVPFGSIIYFLGLEDEKPVLYVEIASRMGSDDLYVIKEDSYDCYDIYDGYPPEIEDKYFGHLKNMKGTKDRFRKNKK